MFNKGLLLGGKIKLYNIIRGSVSNVSLSYSPQIDIKAGTRVNITVNANGGYQNPWVTVSKNDGTGNVTVSGSGSSRYFMMPKSDVTITAGASVIPTYSVSGSASGGGISFSRTSGIRAGEIITVYLSPNSYHALSSLTSSPYVSFSGSGNIRTFTMPSSNIRITATFLANYTHIISSGYYKDGSLKYNGYINSANSPSGRQLGSVSPTTFGGYTLVGIYSIARSSSSINDQFVLFTQKPPYSRLRITNLESGHTAILYNTHRYGYRNSKNDVNNDWEFVFGQNAHIKLEFLN